MTTKVVNNILIWDPADAEAYEILTKYSAPPCPTIAISHLEARLADLIANTSLDPVGDQFIASVDIEAIQSLLQDIKLIAKA
ncbi:MAG: hypothetical protein C4516_09065 [Oxalobacter sp.]|nr:MAG: hypothetical protein C4516_09065 [Oxalobacter sp.]